MMKACAVGCAAALAFGALAEEIGESEALAVAVAWQAEQKLAGTSEMGVPLQAERHETADGTPFFVVSFANRGYLVVAGDDAVEPVIAFSSTGLPDNAAASPLFGVLARDLPNRPRTQSAKWSHLSGDGYYYKLPKMASSSQQSISDVRVAPLLKSNWGQKTDTGYTSGKACYNYYTPNRGACGCTAVAFAQIMRYWQFPKSAPAGQYLCAMGDEMTPTMLSITAGDYDWLNMPLTTSGGITELQCQAIGKLTYDCAVAIHSYFFSSGTAAYSDLSFVHLTDTFGFASAVGYCPILEKGQSTPMSDIRNAMFSNLDMGCPLMISLLTSYDPAHPNGQIGHQVIVDGYGYVGGTEFVHLNMGWNTPGETCDVWYNLPNISADTYDFTIIDGMIYNIIPNATGDILSGRVVDADGKPVPNVVVKATGKTSSSAKSSSSSFTVTSTQTTDENGIYAFLLPGGKTYTVSCGSTSKVVPLPHCESAVCDWSKPLQPKYSKAGTCGNSWGNDFVYNADTPGDDPDPDDPSPSEDSQLGAFAPTKAYNGVAPYCGAVYNASGAACGTISLKVGKPSKKGVSKVSGTLALLDGKKYSVKSTDVAVNENGPAMVEGIEIKNIGRLDLAIGNRGFSATIWATSGTMLTAATSDLTKGLPVGTATFSVIGLPGTIDGYPVLDGCSPNGQSVSVSAKGKWDCGKAASIKYKKITVKDPETKKSTYHYELQGLDDPKKPNRSGLKLTYKAKTATFTGSFYVYTDTGTEAKPKLKKLSAKIVGFVIDGKAVGMATINKVGSYAVVIQ